ncbi:F-box only protein 5-like [Elysia marginata]|uniref:F-box only protein 5-like n=1 Tax=Elysia marginata TaxID=1093978 RepID=A0AAV4ELV2_9GAST|nr:F-box only protein 5-like [Elysia marginata]
MNEPVPKSIDKMEKTFVESEAISPTDGEKAELPFSEEFVFDRDSQDFKTPLPLSCGHRSRLARAQNTCDSGFGSAQRGAFSDRSSSVGSSIPSSPGSSTTSSKERRVTLGTCDFSPVTRESFSVIRSRKLDFHSADLLPVSARLQFVDEDAKSQESLSEGSDTQGKRDSCEDMSVEDNDESLSPVCPGLFSFNDAHANSHQRRSVSPEDLEVSLQDMSLEESSSSSSSSSSRSGSGSGSPSQFTILKKNIPQTEERFNSVSCSIRDANETPVRTHIFDWVNQVSKTLQSSTPETITTPTRSCKVNFMTALHLASASTITNDLIASSTNSIYSSNAHNSQVVSSSLNSKPSAHTASQLHQPEVCPPESCSVKSQSSDVSTLSLLAQVPISKSPCKRTGVDKLDNNQIFSPTKSRKLERCLKLSPLKSAACQIFPDDLNSHHAVGANLDTSQTSLLSNLDHLKDIESTKRTLFCESAEKLHPHSNGQNKCGYSLESSGPSINLHRMLQMSLPSEPSRLIGRNIGVAKMDIIAALHSSFNLCVAKIFSFLQAEDLISVVMVSKAWRHALEADSSSFHKYQLHLRDMARRRAMLVYSGKENAMEKVIDTPKSKPLTESKGCFSSLQFQASPKATEPISHKPKCKSGDHQTVQWGDELRHCPSCQHPALVRPHQGRAVCMKASCGFDFCTQCFSAYHHPKPCKPLNRSVSKKDVAGSLKSKKSLKRL